MPTCVFDNPFTPDLTGQLLDGKVDVSAEAASTTGFITPMIAPGKSLLLTLNLTPGSDAIPDGFYGEIVSLGSADGSVIYGQTQAVVTPTATKGTTDHDMFVKTGGQKQVRAGDDTISANALSSLTVADGGAAKLA